MTGDATGSDAAGEDGAAGEGGTTWTALTTLPGEGQARALADAMEALEPEPMGVGVFELEDGSGLWEVGGYFTAPPDDVALDLLAAAHAARPFAVSELPPTDWVAEVRRELPPVGAGRFVVYGAHAADAVPAGAVGLLIEASMAFGTGHHGTTLGCLEALDRLAASGARIGSVADIGSGTAVLAMAAAHLWPEARIEASDIDPVAVEVAAANLAANDLAGRVGLCAAAGFAHDRLRAAAPFDLICANILKGPLIELAPDMAAHAAPGGLAILSGILVKQADEVRAAYAAAGFEGVGRDEIGEWVTLVLRRP